jgi:hypothetical protein
MLPWLDSGLLRFARNDEFPHSRGMICPSLAKQYPRKTEGAGNTGCTPHPQPCVQKKKARKQVTAGTPKRSGIPCAMVYGL